MPRDLESECETLKGMPELTSSPGRADSDELQTSPFRRRKAQVSKDGIHPLSSTLTIDNLEECLALENAAFPEELRATRAKFEYRLRKCSNLSFAIYTPFTPSSPAAPLLSEAVTLPLAASAGTEDPVRKKVLLAHIISTMSTNETVEDEDMAVPQVVSQDPLEYAFQAPDEKPRLGHKAEGRTICLHSLAVLPSMQRKGYGLSILKAYVDRMEAAGAGDRIALLCVESLVPFYERAGFKSLGRSRATFGGATWVNMVRELKSQDEQIEDIMGIQGKRVSNKIASSWLDGEEGVSQR